MRWPYIIAGIAGAGLLAWILYLKRNAVKGLIGMDANYQTVPGQPYGPVWKDQLPPGAPADLRPCSAPGAGEPFLRSAVPFGTGRLVDALIVLGRNESGLMLGRPADLFDVRPPAERGPGNNRGRGRISAYGLFQWNTGAWQGFTGRSEEAYEVSTADEVALPVKVYTKLWREVLANGGDERTASCGIFLWHRRPFTATGYTGFLAALKRGGPEAAYEMIAQADRGPVGSKLVKMGFPGLG